MIFSVSVSEFSFMHFVIHTFELTKLHISLLKGSEDGTLYLGLTVLLTLSVVLCSKEIWWTKSSNTVIPISR